MNPAPASQAEIDRQIKELEPEVIRLYRHFHQYPELGFKEFRTAEFIETYLADLGLDPFRSAGTGVAAVLDSGKPGPTLMLRADMDALPVTEATGLEFASKNPGVMHACGHDAHMAMLLTAARVLADHRTFLKGKIKLVFQPNEEAAGAIYMIEEGIMENPKVDAAMGIHIWSQLPSGQVGISSGTVMGGLDVFRLTITGRGGHTGYPHKAVDPVIAAAGVIQGVQAVQTREMDAREPTIIMFGRLSAGEKANIIPEQVTLEGTIRFLAALPEHSPDNPTQKFIRICQHICEAHLCTCNIDIDHENIPLVNDDRMVQMARQTAVTVFGSPDAVTSSRYIASEDFSEFSSRVPGAFMFLGCADPSKGTDVSHHHPAFAIDESVLTKGVALHVHGALAFLNRK
ncbi:MAG: amidohydrolase [Desulfotignum sp.]|nr:amidohydrolase [Desulfotignum sp.]